MHLIILPKNSNDKAGNGNLLRFAVSSQPIADIVLLGLRARSYKGRISKLCANHNGNFICAVPKEWSIGRLPPCFLAKSRRGASEGPRSAGTQIITYSEDIPISSYLMQKSKLNGWFVFSNGRFVTQFNNDLLDKILVNAKAHVLAVNADPKLLAYREKVRLTTKNIIAGICRCYADSTETVTASSEWPHHVFVKTDVLNQVFNDHILPISFTAFIEKCRSFALTLRAINVAGIALDLETEEGLLNLCWEILSKIWSRKLTIQNSNTIAQDARLVGKVLLGKNVHIGQNAILVGPSIVGNNVIIEQGAVIKSSIIGSNVVVPRNQLIQNSVLKSLEGDCPPFLLSPAATSYDMSRSGKQESRGDTKFDLNEQIHADDIFRNWPRFSYAGCFKRITDCLAAIIVLILFAPITPFIALVIKLTSPGPVFFKDKRQGLHGKEFYCLKFRSMTAGADNIQDKLRAVSQVDGPQFKMKDDPRLTAVGRFLRDTYIDEIPQFINVLLGQMSIVGPRPSPQSENTLCPYWRDARLSVRPGITGLWQVCRTRQPLKDFQEWIHYDTEYVKNLSFVMDLWICWQTVKKLAKDFVRQF